MRAALASTLILSLAAATTALAQEVTRGPYLQVGTASSAIVRWRTDVPTNSVVHYGTTLGLLDSTCVDSLLTTEHIVTVAALAPETRYYYSVGSTDSTLAGNDIHHAFKTAPNTGELRPTRIWVIGDSGTKGLRAAGVRNAYRNFPGADSTDVWLMLGDNAYETGTDEEYQAAVFDMYPTILRNTILWSTRGNHELFHSGPNNDYYEIFTMPVAGEAGGLASGTEAYYSFDFANIHFICLDSQGSNRMPGSPMLTWLAQDLAATDQQWVIAFWHHPPYSKGSHDSDTELRLVEMRQYALPILEDHGVDLVLAGHSHSYERSFLLNGHYGLSTTLADSMKVNAGDGRPSGNGAYVKPLSGPGAERGAVYTVAGTSGSVSGGTYDHPVMISSLAKLGSLVLDVNGQELRATFIDTTGAALDSFVVVKEIPQTTDVGPLRTPFVRLTSRPNPFSSHAQLEYIVPAASRATLTIYNVRGQRVRMLLDQRVTEGTHTAIWDGHDDRGDAVAQGVYFATLHAAGEKRTHRLVLVK